jgi:hypothetical protein
MRTNARGTGRTRHLPGPHTMLLWLWSWVALRCDDLMFRNCRAYRRRQFLKRLRRMLDPAVLGTPQGNLRRSLHH